MSEPSLDQERIEELAKQVLILIRENYQRGPISRDRVYEVLNALAFCTAVTVRGDRISVDYAGTSPQTPVGINCCWNYTYAETVFPLICVVRPATPVNGGCLRICVHGPTMVVYPEGTWYHGMTAERIPELVRRHLIEGKPVEEWVFARNQLGDDEPER